MNGSFDRIVASAAQSQAQIGELLGKLLTVAQPGSVFGAPVTAGEYTIINVSEVRPAWALAWAQVRAAGDLPRKARSRESRPIRVQAEVVEAVVVAERWRDR